MKKLSACFVSLAAACGALFAPIASADTAVACGNGDPTQQLPLSITTPDYGTATGFYTLPSGAPRALVVFSHGFEASPTRWFAAMQKISGQTGAITIALYNPGEGISTGGTSTTGWFVKEGAQAGISAAKLFDSACPQLAGKTFVDYGVSMGGNTSGLIAAAQAKRADGTPLFDYWFDIEGAVNPLETYLEAKAAGASGNAYANDAWKAIQQDAGGQTPDQNPQGFDSLVVVDKAASIKAAGIKGVVIVHGVDDGLVPHNQSREMESALSGAGVPTDFYTAVTKQPGTSSGSTLDGDVPVAHDSPFAGHGSEGDLSHTVTGTGINLLLQTLNGLIQPPGCHREFVVDGTAGSLANPSGAPLIAPDPASTPDPACST